MHRSQTRAYRRFGRSSNRANKGRWVDWRVSLSRCERTKDQQEKLEKRETKIILSHYPRRSPSRCERAKDRQENGERRKTSWLSFLPFDVGRGRDPVDPALSFSLRRGSERESYLSLYPPFLLPCRRLTEAGVRWLHASRNDVP